MLRTVEVLLLAAFATARVCCAQLASIEAIDRELLRKAEAGQFSGSVLIAKGDRILLDTGYGRGVYPDGVANTGSTRFRIGSLTKQFTAAAILELRDEGKLSLDDLVCRYVQPCPDTWAEIKLVHLLTHASGIPSYNTLPNYNDIKVLPMSTADLLAQIRSLPVRFVPGSAFEYSDSGYAILGAVIERVSGSSYAEFMRAKLLDPLGMTDTACSNLSGSDARGYVPTDDGRRPATGVDASVAFSASGMYSTTRDLLRWARALMSGRVLSDRSRREMFTPGREDFGYGWIVPENTSPVTYLHFGALAGFESAIFLLPDLRVTAIVLSNVEGTDVQSLAANNAIVGAYAEYQGDYALPELKKTLRVFLKAGTLRAQTTRGPALTLDYVSGDAFVALRGTESEVRIEFSRDEAGEVVGVLAEQFGKRFSGTRKPAAGTSAGGTPGACQPQAPMAPQAVQNSQPSFLISAKLPHSLHCPPGRTR